MSELAIIGGTGLTSLETLEITKREIVHTPYGEPSGPLTFGELAGKEVIFLARHGYGHTIPPHMVNYRANLWALHEAGVKNIVAVNAVGGIRDDMGPGALVVPDQIIDYTTGRINTFFEEGLSSVVHVDFTHPYDRELMAILLSAGDNADIDLVKGGTYGATQGPRLETAAEIRRMKQDGCDLVGMTGMPETVLARELDINYCSCCVVANWAAGLDKAPITMEAIEQELQSGMEKVRSILTQLIPLV